MARSALPAIVAAAVEGLVDEAVIQRMALDVGIEIHAVYGKTGRTNLIRRAGGFNAAARFANWLVVADLDRTFECAPDAVHEWLPQPARGMRFRIAVQEVEAWLLADRSSVARYLRVSEARIPEQPELLMDPKATLVGAARHSRSRELREDLVPSAQGGRVVGPGYTPRMLEFVSAHWRPDVAAGSSDSLRRCLAAMRW